MEKTHIIEQIQRTAAANGGIAPGWRKLAAVTGINYSDWCGVHWARWNDALGEAGFAPNRLTQAYEESELLGLYAGYTSELGQLPTGTDLRLKTKRDPHFPNDRTFDRLGSKLEIVAKLISYCRDKPELTEVASLASKYFSSHQTQEKEVSSNSDRVCGYVYMIRYGRKYKIGFTNSPIRRFREVSIELPDETIQIHTIATDDPNGIEEYWHKRFAAKRIRKSEWFELSGDDVRAFKRRDYQ